MEYFFSQWIMGRNIFLRILLHIFLAVGLVETQSLDVNFNRFDESIEITIILQNQFFISSSLVRGVDPAHHGTCPAFALGLDRTGTHIE